MDFEWGRIVRDLNWTLVSGVIHFLILVWLMKRLLFKRALAYLDQRRERIAGQMEAARLDQERAMQLVQRREEELQAAQARARRIEEEANNWAEKIITQAKVQAKIEAARLIADAKIVSEREQELIRADLRHAYAEIVVSGAAQVLEREINIDDHRQLIDKLLDSIEEEPVKMRS
ncbi:F0F1 ATP synthase subunit B [Candidatus Acetothermia bacterium]|nr:F0F1 ATP synthase subunit B [Candidatus Acetothermia bacterium]